MKKITLLMLTVLFTGTLLNAQSIDEGKNFLYYDRLTSAKNTFNAVVNKDAKDADAIYWLGQTYLRQDSVQAAKSLYEKGLAGWNKCTPCAGRNGTCRIIGRKK
jgi:thioredoxin-like negative regulator of GroEL